MHHVFNFLRCHLKSFSQLFDPRVATETLREGDRERIQVFEGIVIKRRGGGIQESYTVRRISHGIGVERVFAVHSPMVDKIEVSRRGRVRRSRLYYLRERVGRAARVKEARR